MKQLNQSELLEVNGGFIEVFIILSFTYWYYIYMKDKGYFKIQDTGRW